MKGTAVSQAGCGMYGYKDGKRTNIGEVKPNR